MTAPAAGGEPDSAPPRGPLVLLALILVAAVANLNLAVANVALPDIGKAFDSSQTTLNLIAVGYSFGLAASVLYLGALGDRYGRKMMLIGGVLLSIPARLLAAYAPTDGVLALARILGGLSAGMAYPTTLALITALWSGQSRTKSIALWSAIGGGISALGPLIAGALLEQFWWGSVFLITLPLAVVALVMALKFVPSHVNEASDPVDNLGGVLSALMVGALILGINFAAVPDKGTLAIGLGVIAAAAAAAFVIRQRRARNPLYDLDIAGRRIFWVAAVAGIIVFGSLMAAMFIGQQFLQNVLGYDTLEAGAAILPAVILMVIVAPRSAKLIEVKGSRFTLLCGYVFCFLGFLTMLTLWDTGSPYWQVGLAYAFIGTGVGLAGTPASHSLTGSVPVRRAGMASATADLQRDLGGAIMQSILGALLTAGYAAAFSKAIAGSPNAASVSTNVQSELTKSFSSAANTAAQYPQYSKQIIAAAQTSFIDGADWAYVAGLVAIVLGAALVFFLFPKHDGELELLARYHAEDSDDNAVAALTWIRDTDEKAQRRPADIALLVVSAILALLVGFWAQTQSTVNVNLFRTLNDLSGNMVGLAKGVYALGSIWAVLAVTAVLLVLRQFRVAVYGVLAGAGAFGLALLLNEALGTHAIGGLAVNVRIGDGPVYPVANVAAITALAFAIAPFIVRPLRRVFAIVILMVCTAAMYLGAGFPADVLGGLLVGFGIAALVRVLFGAPGGQPSVAEVRVALADLGYDVVNIAPATERIERAAVMDVELATGEHLRVDAFGRDQRDARIAAKVWHRAMYHDPGVPVFGSRIQQVEHIAFTLMVAERANVPSARLVRTGVGGADAALLVTTPPRGTPIGSVPSERVTDDVLRDAWKQLDALHCAGIAHGTIDGLRVLVDDDGTVAFDDFSAADASGEEYWRNRDDAALLVLSAQLVGDDRAIAAMVAGVGKDHAGAVIPVVQPAALPSGLTKGVKHQGKELKALRGALVTASGAEDVPPLKIKRLSLLNIGMLIGVLFAVGIAFHSMEGIDWASVKGEFENATWAWAFLALLMYPLVPTSWATALMGCVNKDLPFVPTVLTQLACSFLNLITPNGIGGTALQIDYLHKQDVPVASAASAMVLSTGVGGAIQMILFLSAAAITATAVDSGSSSDSSSSNALLIIAVVAALVGVVLFIPKIKNKVVPAVKRAASDIWAVVRNPRKAMQLIGGDTAGNLIYPLILGVCMLAFNQHLDFAQLIVVQVGAGMIGNVAPVPGGIGVTEAALTAGLTSFGIPPAPALASVLLFRGITFLIPPIFGFFTLRWLRAKGYA